MDKEELRRQLRATFLEEMEEYVADINSCLLELEQSPPDDDRDESLRTLLRALHSLKGGARLAHVSMIEQASHALEDRLAPSRDGGGEISAELFALLYKAADAIEEAGMRLREEQALDDAPLALLLPELLGGAETQQDETQQAETQQDETEQAEAEQAEAEQAEAEPVGAEQAKKPAPAAPNGRQAEAADGSPPQTPAPDRATEEETTPVDSTPVDSTPDASTPDEAKPRPPLPDDATAGDAAHDDARKKHASPAGAASARTSSPAGGAARKAVAASVRVSADKLDALLAQAGELLVARQRIDLGVEELDSLRDSVSVWRRERRTADSELRQNCQALGEVPAGAAVSKAVLRTLEESDDRIRQFERDLDRLVGRARGNSQYLGQVGACIEDDVQRARLLPFADACRGLERAVRDVAASTGKRARLELAGADVQMDRSVLEGIKAPLLHLVRNAVDHGLESPDERRAAGKDEQGTIRVEAAVRGGNVEVAVRDDGGGIDLQRIAEKASARQIPTHPHELARLIFMPAFSTADKVSDVSGRGVGLDVVRSEIERLHGSVDVSFETGRWTCFSLQVPLTLTTMRAVLVEAAGQTFAIPTGGIDRVVRFAESDQAKVAGRRVLLIEGKPVAVTGLAAALGMEGPRQRSSDGKSLAVILSAGSGRVAVVVDGIASELELTAKSLGPRVRRMKYVLGATLLPSGELALVLNVANLVRSAGDSTAELLADEQASPAPPARPRLLVVDDSVTSRTLLRTILDGAGYEVAVAVDGHQALELTQSRPFDLVVSDVDMPRLDGFGLVEAIRESRVTRELPVVLVTGRSSEEDRVRGIQAGANAYIIKSGFDQTRLTQIVAELLQGPS